MKAKSRVFFESWGDAQSTPGDGYVRYRGTEPDLQRTYFSNDPRLDEAPRYGWRLRGSSGLTTVHTLSDAVRVTRHLTFTAGVGYTHISTETRVPVPVLTWETTTRASFHHYRKSRPPRSTARGWQKRCRTLLTRYAP